MLDFFKRRKVSSNLILLLGSTFVLLSIIVTTGVYGIQVVNKRLNILTSESVPILDLLNRLQANYFQKVVLVKQRLGTRKGVEKDRELTGQIEEHHKKIIGLIDEVGEKLKRIIDRHESKEEERYAYNIDYELRGLYKVYMDHCFHSDKVLNRLRQNKIKDMGEAVIAIDKLQDNLSFGLENLVGVIRDYVNNTTRKVHREGDRAIFVMVAVSILVMVLSISLGVVIYRSISEPLVDAVDIANKIERGVRKLDFGTHNANETGDLLRSLERMANSLLLYEEEMVKQVELANAASKAKSDFLSTMSHEIRTPLNGVIGMTDLLLSNRLEGDALEYVQTIKNSGELLMGIINDVLDFTKMEDGKLKVESIDIELVEIAKEVLNLFQARAKEKALNLILSSPENRSFHVMGDPLRLRQVLSNLVSNAIKFTNSGRVEMNIQVVNESDGEITLNLEVIDTGIGISQEDKTKLFDKFSQADMSTTRQFGGTGLGLAIVKHLVGLMEGEVTCRSEGLNQGSTFGLRITFPKQTGKELLHQEKPQGGKENSQREGVLLIEDSKLNRNVFIHNLKRLGLDCDVAVDGTQAMSLIKEKCYRLIFTDIHLPDINGLELTKKLREMPGNDEMIIVAITADVIEFDKHKCLDAGMNEYVSKPYTYDQLREVVQEFLDLPRLDEKPHVLIVEDNKINLKLISKMVDALGCSFDAAENGQLGVDLFAKNDYELVLMDIQMPVMNGFDATKAIRQTEKGKGIPIIAVTANTTELDRKMADEAGMNDFLEKPVKKEVLKTAMSKFLSFPT